MFDFRPVVLVKFVMFCQQINKGFISVSFYEPEGICHLASKHLQRAYTSNLDLVGFSAEFLVSRPFWPLFWAADNCSGLAVALGVQLCCQMYSSDIAVEQVTPDF